MAYRHRYVDPDASGTGAGTSWTNAYTSLNAAEQAEDNSGDIRATGGSNEIVVFHCRASAGTADTAAANISGWTTDSGGYIVVVAEAINTSYGGGESETTGTGRHVGVWTTARYRLTVSDATALSITEDYVSVIGLQVSTISPSANSRHVLQVTGITATTNAIQVSTCILVGHSHATYTQYGLYIQDADALTSVFNVLIYGITAISSSFACVAGGTTNNIYSCTLIGGQNALYVSGAANTTNAKNVYGGGSSSEDFVRISGTLNKTNCASEDQTADDTGTGETATNCVAAAVAVNTTNFTNVTAGSEDFRLPAGSALIGAGTDTSGESAPLNFTVDIAGNARS